MYIFVAAGGEIGGTTARDLAKCGATLSMIDIHEGRMNETLASLKKAGVSNKRVSSNFSINPFATGNTM